MIYIYDFEVTAFNWIMVVKPVGGEHLIFCNDNEAVQEFMKSKPLLGGFNTKHYDQFILKAVLAGWEPSRIKALNDHIIAGGNGWEVPDLKGIYFGNFDLMDDMQVGLSLKSIEAHLGMNIVESSVPFDIDRPLTDEELDEMIEYCKADVDATEKLFHLRKNYLENKVYIGGLKGIPPEKALYMTNAKLTAAYLDATPPAEPWTDERDYTYPDNLLREYIPKEVFDFFDRLHDKSIPDEEVFKSKLELNIGDCVVTLGYGGIHAAIEKFVWEEGVI